MRMKVKVFMCNSKALSAALWKPHITQVHMT